MVDLWESQRLYDIRMSLGDYAAAAAIAKDAIPSTQCQHCLKDWERKWKKAARLAKWQKSWIGFALRWYSEVPD